MVEVKKICDISRFEIKLPKHEVTQEEIDKKIYDTLKENLVMCDKDGPIKKRDTVYITFTGKTADGEKFKGSDADNVAAVIGEGDFISEFDEQLIDHYKGDNFDITLIPKDDFHIPELRGKQLIFNVTINKISYEELPELNNYFVKKLGIAKINTVDDFMEFLIGTIELEHLTNMENVTRNMLINQIVTNSEFNISEVEVTDEAKRVVKQFENKLFYQGLVLEEYLEAEKMTKADLERKYRDEALKNIKVRTLISHLVNELNIEVSDEELYEEAEKVELRYGQPIKELLEMGAGKKESFRSDLKRKKVVDLLLERCEIEFI